MPTSINDITGKVADAIKIANLYADAINGQFSCIRVILFGSYAKGNFREENENARQILINSAGRFV